MNVNNDPYFFMDIRDFESESTKSCYITLFTPGWSIFERKKNSLNLSSISQPFFFILIFYCQIINVFSRYNYRF